MRINALSAAVLIASCGIASAQQVQKLDSLSGRGASFAWGINDQGQIVGESVTSTGVTHATMWGGSGAPTDLGTTAGAVHSVAYAINESGQVVGYSEVDSGLRTSTLWSGGTARDLGTEMGALGSNVAWAINDNGVVAGQAPLGPGFAKGYVWNETEGGAIAGGSRFYMGGANYGINNDGVLVGSGFFFGDPDDAFLSTPDGRGGYEDSDIAPPGYNFSVCKAISNTGIAVGHTSAGVAEGWQASIFNGRGDVTLLGTLDGLENSEAKAVNDSGMIVGYAWDNDFEIPNAAWAYVDGVMYNLNDFIEGSEFIGLYQATGVNNNGDIVGFGELADGTVAGFLIEGFVPAPGTLSLFAMGLGAATRRRRN